MKPTDRQLKEALAKMLPQRLVLATWIPFGGTVESYELKWIKDGFRSSAVEERELLSICWDIEEEIYQSDKTFDMNKIFTFPSGDYRRALIGITQHSEPVHATWQQRTMALAVVKGISLKATPDAVVNH